MFESAGQPGSSVVEFLALDRRLVRRLPQAKVVRLLRLQLEGLRVIRSTLPRAREREDGGEGDPPKYQARGLE